MPILGAEHDFAHPVESDKAWSESYYFNCYDPVTECGFYTRIGVRPNEGTLDSGIVFWLPNHEMVHVRGVREQRTMIDEDLTAGGVRYRRIEPGARWQVTVDCEGTLRELDGLGASRGVSIAMDATFSRLTPAIGADGQRRTGHGPARAARDSVGKGHFEQAGRWVGWIEVDGVRHALVEARGNRDKSWGPRRWARPRMWRWFSINFGDDVHLGGIRIGTDAGDLHRGWIWRDGEHQSVRHWDVRTDVGPDGIAHRVCRVTATDASGRRHELHGRVIRLAAAPSEGTVVNEGLAVWEYEGRVGYGIAEYLHQIGGDGRPIVPIE